MIPPLYKLAWLCQNQRGREVGRTPPPLCPPMRGREVGRTPPPLCPPMRGPCFAGHEVPFTTLLYFTHQVRTLKVSGF